MGHAPCGRMRFGRTHERKVDNMKEAVAVARAHGGQAQHGGQAHTKMHRTFVFASHFCIGPMPMGRLKILSIFL